MRRAVRSGCWPSIRYSSATGCCWSSTTRRLASGTSPSRVRIVLLARALGDWWLHLTALDSRVGEILNGPVTSPMSLRPLAPDPTERHRLFEQAARAFERVVPGAHSPRQPSLEASHYDRALYV